MKSSMNLKGDVKAGKITVEQALDKLKDVLEGDKTQTYRRLKRGSIQPVKVEKPKAEKVVADESEPKKKKSKKSKE